MLIQTVQAMVAYDNMKIDTKFPASDVKFSPNGYNPLYRRGHLGASYKINSIPDKQKLPVASNNDITFIFLFWIE